MRPLGGLLIFVGLATAASFAVGQPPDGPGRESLPGGDRRGDDGDPQDRGGGFVARMLRFDADGDGSLMKAEVADERLARLFARADADGNGAVTREELTALDGEETQTYGRSGFGGPGRGPGGPGGFGPPGRGPGPGGFGPPGGPAPPRPGEVLSPRVREELGLSAEQEERVVALQKEVDEKIEQILNEDQLRRLKEMREFGPGGFGPPGGGPPGRGTGGGGDRRPRDR